MALSVLARLLMAGGMGKVTNSESGGSRNQLDHAGR